MTGRATKLPWVLAAAAVCGFPLRHLVAPERVRAAAPRPQSGPPRQSRPRLGKWHGAPREIPHPELAQAGIPSPEIPHLELWHAGIPSPEVPYPDLAHAGVSFPDVPHPKLVPVAAAPAYEATLRAARGWRTQADADVVLELEARDEANPDLMDGPADDALRHRLSAADRTGDLARARKAALGAAALARTPDQVYRAAEFLVLVECGAGHHNQELKEAWKLVRLRPESEQALLVLRHAAECNRSWALCQWVDERRSVLAEEGKRPRLAECNPASVQERRVAEQSE